MLQPPSFSILDPDVMRLIETENVQIFDPTRSVYTNRDLDLGRISLVGFDMDYTLAVYKKESMEQLQFDLTIKRLIEVFNYPKDITAIQYDPLLMIRGLVVDKKLGHLLKMDAHGRAIRAFHGETVIEQKILEKLYQNLKIRVGANFASLDTLFALPEACLYAKLIAFFDARMIKGQSIEPVYAEGHLNVDYEKIFDHVRASMDGIHADGTLKSLVMRDIGSYIHANSDTALTLHKLRSAGKKTFLLTNSHWTYTNAVMEYLLGNRLPEYLSWRAYFDIVIVASNKPLFFSGHSPFMELSSENEEKANMLTNSDHFDRNKIYVGGNLKEFERLTKINGQEVLYVGDHIYGDIVRSKKETFWRTCLVVEELPAEIKLLLEHTNEVEKLAQMDAERLNIDMSIGHHRALLVHIEGALLKTNEKKLSDASIEKLNDNAKVVRREIDQAKKFLRELDEQIQDAFDQLEKHFHPVWGRIMRERQELSRFGEQVTSYACIYTSCLTNLLQYSPVHYFRTRSELMTHDRVLLHKIR